MSSGTLSLTLVKFQMAVIPADASVEATTCALAEGTVRMATVTPSLRDTAASSSWDTRGYRGWSARLLQVDVEAAQ